MKNKISFIACLIIGVVLIQYRLSYSDIQSGKPLKITTWDAFGYYMYLPSAVIYNDMTELAWLPEMDSTYQLTGGDLYQANRHTNGNYVNKYLGGISIMQAPFFFVAHLIAINSHYNADGFSPPYQYAIAFAAIFYCLLGLFLLRAILLKYYQDRSVALSILMLGLATNLIQYVSIDSAMSHAYIFPLYVFVIFTTIKWHESPHLKWAILTGLIIGIATISRPTEAIMLFIPLLWNMETKEASKAKWKLVKSNRKHVLFAIFFGVLGVAPQLIYWKMTSGSFVYDVGSKWFFLNPYFRVLFGFENGWFIYTPITVLFVLGFFFIKRFPFRKSVIVFCLLNIWIVISWSDWKYGATYSTRALVQSYPVFMLAFTGFVEWTLSKKLRIAFLGIFGFLIYANLFQIWQYNETILHYRDMNRSYYSRIYLNANPTPLDMSLLDTDEVLKSESDYNKNVLYSGDTAMLIANIGDYPDIIAQGHIFSTKEDWIKVELTLRAKEGYASSYINCKIQSGEKVKEKLFRMPNAMNKANEENDYEFYVVVPDGFKNPEILVFTTSFTHFSGVVERVELIHLGK